MKDLSFKTLLPFVSIAVIGSPAESQAPPKMKMTTEIPSSITTPDSVETRIGTLRFFGSAQESEQPLI